jgi:Mrp family chromosome partitioning ATPase
LSRASAGITHGDVLATRSRLSRPRLRSSAAVAVCGVIGVLVGLIVSLASTRYQASSLVRIGQKTSQSTTGQPTVDQLDRYVQTELYAFTSRDLLDEVGGKAHVAGTPNISATQLASTDVIRVTAEADTPATAVALADTAVDVYMKLRLAASNAKAGQTLTTLTGEIDQTRQQMDQLGYGNVDSAMRSALDARLSRLVEQQDQVQLDASGEAATVQVVTSAAAEGGVPASSPLSSALLGGLLGALAGVGVAILLSRSDGRVEGPGDLRDIVPPKTIVEIPKARRDRRGLASGPPSRAVREPSDRPGQRPVVPQLRRLSYGLARVTATFGQPVLVVGDTTGAGASFVATELALNAARKGPTILVAAGDVLDGRISMTFGIPTVYYGGMATAARGQRPVDELQALLRPTSVDQLEVLVEGPRGDDGLERLEEAAAMHGLGKTLALLNAAVVIDAPPLNESTLALDLAEDAGAAVFVVREGVSQRQHVRASIDLLTRVRPQIDVVVLNRAGTPSQLLRRFRRWRTALVARMQKGSR